MSERDAVPDVAGPWLPLGEVAARAGLSRDALVKRCRRGSVAARKVGGRWQVRLDSVRVAARADPGDVLTYVREDAQDALVAQLRGEVAYLRERVATMEQALIEQARRPWWRFWGP